MTRTRSTSSRARGLDDDLIAMLLGDAPAEPRLVRWLASAEGRRELAAYQKTLAAMRRLYQGVRASTEESPAYYAAIATPIGRVLIAVTAAGVVRISFRQSESAFAAELRARLRAEVVRSPANTADAAHQLEAYFSGKRRAFDLAVDLRLVTPFQRRVLLATRKVPAGRLVSYGDIARRIGQPGASRAVGNALGQNPIPIVIPCHRIIAAGGRIGGYTGGLDIKRKLLDLEGATVDR